MLINNKTYKIEKNYNKIYKHSHSYDLFSLDVLHVYVLIKFSYLSTLFPFTTFTT